ncbi:TetR/AcrR family transcriptional regulator [Lactobacillus sp. CC-MHH1034]|uniref:TetR/AcrR family transcriptional regulator n=1 Tax=Agrilactobacillus fermenti TaxID=2586909 RepID=UPI001E44A6A9|nr:TetR/AcrR family transcriptional regulator [Agrilactobacillus fermenti]MCD2256804.1 TetR/AcrR family transcriptional regulator [Agrilactobacillus fermenti]
MTLKNIDQLFQASLAQSDLSAKQKAVLQASLMLFAEKGFERTTTRDIATLAQVSEGTVYKQFKTKQQILDAILQPFITQVFPQAANEFIAELTARPVTSLHAFIQFIVYDRINFGLTNQKQLKVLVQQLLDNGRLLAELGRVFDKVLQGPVKSILDQLQRQGELVNWSHARIFRHIISTVLGYVLPIIILPIADPDVEKITAEATEFLYAGLHQKKA